MEFNGQRIVEAPDIARMLWLTRSQIRDTLNYYDPHRIAAWLRQSDTANFSHRNNWLLFPAVVQAFLKSTGMQQKPDYRSYHTLKGGSCRQAGWFRDGARGPVDYYNAWGITYDLF